MKALKSLVTWLKTLGSRLNAALADGALGASVDDAAPALWAQVKPLPPLDGTGRAAGERDYVGLPEVHF